MKDLFRRILSLWLIISYFTMFVLGPVYSVEAIAADSVSLDEHMGELLQVGSTGTMPDSPAGSLTIGNDSTPGRDADQTHKKDVEEQSTKSNTQFFTLPSAGNIPTGAIEQKDKKASDTLLPSLGQIDDTNKKEAATDVTSAHENVADQDHMLSGFKQFWSIASADDPVQSGITSIGGVAQGAMNNAIRDWLGQKANFQLKYDFSGQGEVKALLPLWDEGDNVLFSQLGFLRTEDRTIYNVGLGARHWLNKDWALGLNSFWDYDTTGDNARVGVGAETWTNYLKLSANGYFRLTDWHQSPLSEMEDYDERPANGFDIRASTWMPFLPQVGADLIWEKYYGKDVAISSSSTSPDDLEDSPSVVTTSVNYTPFPLLSIDAGHRGGSISENFVNLSVNYRLGVSWGDQVDTSSVEVMRSLAASRYDFVDRNNNIVMQYRKQDLIGLSLSAPEVAEAASQVIVDANVHAKYGLKSIAWKAPELEAAGGKISEHSSTSLAVTLPGYRADANNTYTVSAVATDTHGNNSPESSVVISLMRSSNVIVLSVDPSSSVVANGQDYATATALVKDKNGAPLANMDVAYEMSGDDHQCRMNGKTGCETTFKTDSMGSGSVKISSTKAGKFSLTASLQNGNSDNKNIEFVADSATALVAELKAAPANDVLADGHSVSVLTAVIKDANGNPIKGASVSFSANSPAALSASSVESNENGEAAVNLTSPRSGSVDVNASIDTDVNGKSIQVGFIADARDSKVDLAADKLDLVADGHDTSTLTATVKDSHGNPVTGTQVIFSADKSIKLSGSSVMTDNQGQAVVQASSSLAGKYSVSVKHGASGSTDSISLTFEADSNTATVASLSASPASNIAADGTASSVLTATIKDANGNLLKDANVIFSADSAVLLSGGSAVTNESGQASITASSTHAGQYSITAITAQDATGKAVSVSFVADGATASIDTLTANPVQDLIADGVTKSTITATVKDANGNLLSGTEINFSAGSGVTLSKKKSTTDNHGQTVITATATKAGTFNISATTAFDTTGKSVSVTFIANSGTAVVQSLSAAPAKDVLADGSAVSTLTAKVEDANGNLLSGVDVTFSADSQVKLSGTTVKTGADGLATMTATSTTAGTWTVKATTAYDTTGKSASVQFIADASTAKVESLVADPADDILSDGVTASTLTAVVKDAKGNALSDVTVTFSTTTAQLSTETAVTDDKGAAKVRVTSTKSGAYVVKATIPTDSTGKSTTVVFTAGDIDANNSTFVGDKNIIPSDGNAVIKLTFTARAPQNNPVTGATVSFSVTGLSDSDVSEVSESNGVYTATLTGTTASTGQISVLVDGKTVDGMNALSVGVYKAALNIKVN
ncbi:Ig-like domain-containing protein [Citrobacter sp. Awk 4]|uniref:Ig-like domain-containing protein n=1 Tax=Citrobacter sp. Awk 4 TaxID=2963955 RepID=UPI002303DF49|nr:Ig-like domain-containing protein [Citrobacter sp. Awk 4]MDA8481312.1 Ig-like domain-containing protein [Citrobacter sp. Awk 4]